MQGQDKAEQKLSRIANEIAAIMGAEVSSIYVRRKNGRLELFATKGLAPSAVHQTQLDWDEGLVGLVARTAEPVAVRDAPKHPAFSFRPETAEDPLHSFLGVPIIREGNVIGVLTVQNQEPVSYSEDDIEALETTAMLVAELLSSSELQDVIDPETDIARDLPHMLEVDPLVEGIACGRIVFHEPRIEIRERFSEDVTGELARLERGFAALEEQLDRMLQRVDLARTGAHRDVLEAYRMFARDSGWRRQIRDAVKTGLTAEGAIERVQNEYRARFNSRSRTFLRARLADFNDLANRLLRVLAEQDGRPELLAQEAAASVEDVILVARTLGPAELLDFDRDVLRGLVLSQAGHGAHVLIVARALGVPVLSGADRVLALAKTGDVAIIDGDTGTIHIRPTADIVAAYQEKIAFRAQRQARYSALRDQPAVTRDGVRIKLLMNAGLLVDLPHLAESGADGIGLFRTELQFMISATLPRQDRQQQMYQTVLQAAGDKPVVFRTLDIGGDKLLPYLRHGKEENPALGYRAIRLALDRPALLRLQVRALMKAAAGKVLNLMLPMISDVSEYRQARRWIDKEQAFLKRHGHALPEQVKIGAMIEVPALLWQLDQLLAEVDFISVGSNDLQQFLFAADRNNALVAQRFDPLHPAFLKVLKEIADAAKAAEVPLTLCGEMAGDPAQAMVLIGLGYRSLSMSPAAIGPVKEMIRSIDTGTVKKWVNGFLEAPDGPMKRRLQAAGK